jgi:transcriptional regulator GlxA family with amidase domain
MMGRQISIIALAGSSGTSIMGAADIFAIANRISERINELDEPLFRVRVISFDGEPVVCSNGYVLAVDGSFADLEPRHIVFISAFAIGGRDELAKAIESWQPVLPWFRQHGREQALIATSCSGSFLLAEAGLLDNKQATTAWWLTKYFAERYPKVELDKDTICSHAENILCGAGTTSYLDVCLAIIEKFAGKHFARLTAKYMMVDNQRRSQAPYAILSLIESDDKVVNKAESWIRANLTRDFRIEEVAEGVAVSPRTLVRRFQHALGETPQSFTQKLRIEKCKVLLETTQLRFGDIVRRCGYSDESAFRRLFKRHCQLSPRDYRRRFNTATAVE